MILANKPIGITPLEVVQLVKVVFPKYKDTKIAYAGRLDPMAEGLLLLLVGDECKNRDAFQSLPKTYEFEVLFGAATDSYDILGLVTKTAEIKSKLDKQVSNYIKNFPKIISQQYPPYSAKTVNGKKLFLWAKENKLDQITIPTKKVTVHSIKLLNSRVINSSDLQGFITKRINLVKGDFRQEQIHSSWENYFKQNQNSRLPVLKFEVNCSSGTYIRAIANQMGEDLGIPAMTLTINRTQIGDYQLKKASAFVEV